VGTNIVPVRGDSLVAGIAVPDTKEAEFCFSTMNGVSTVRMKVEACFQEILNSTRMCNRPRVEKASYLSSGLPFRIPGKPLAIFINITMIEPVLFCSAFIGYGDVIASVCG